MIDIGGWGSPVAQQYGIRSIPALVLYDNRRRTLEGNKAVMAAIR